MFKAGNCSNSVEGSDYLKGSVRSLQTINMYEVLEQVQEAFEQKYDRNPYRVSVQTTLGERFVNAFGGHAQACGFSMHKDDYDEWEVLIKQQMLKLDESQFDYTFYVTDTIGFFDINHKLLMELETLSPYGQGFDFPVFKVKGVKLDTKPRPFGNRMQKDRTPHVEFKVTSPKRIHQKMTKSDFKSHSIWIMGSLSGARIAVF